MEIITKNAKETFEVGRKIGASLKGGEVIALIGDLGAGKTTFIQGLAEGMGIKNKIVSPTFILMRTYKAKEITLYHLDLYRLEGKVYQEVENLGLFDIWNDLKNVVAIEWAEKIKNKLPERAMYIEFESLDNDERKIYI